MRHGKVETPSGNPLDKWWAFLVMSGNQVSNLVNYDHVEFNTITKSGIFTLSTGSGQANGLLTLEEGKTYILRGGSLPTFGTDSAYLELQWYNVTGAIALGQRGQYGNVEWVNNRSIQPEAIAIFTPDVQSQVALRIVSQSNTTALYGSYTHAMIEQIRDEEI